MVAKKAKSKQVGRPPKLPSTPEPRRIPDSLRFDWSGEIHATSHGYTVFQIEDAFDDPGLVRVAPPRANRQGERYADDGRRRILVQPQPNGPYLHIVYTVVEGRIKQFHARRMTDAEHKLYKGR